MKLRKLEAGRLTAWEFAQYAQVERGVRASYTDLNRLTKKLEEQEIYACFAGDQMGAYLVIERNHPYCSGSLHIAELKPNWMFFTDEVLVFLMRETAAHCVPVSGERFVTVDVRRHHDPLSRVYHSAGFRMSIQTSLVDEEHVVMMLPVSELLKSGE